MKSILSLFVFFAATAAFATPIDVIIYGNGGGAACVSQNQSSFSKKYYIARGLTRMEAEVDAYNACTEDANFPSDCGRVQCVNDSRNTRAIRATVEVRVGNARVDLSVSGMDAGAQCMAQNKSAFSKRAYLATAGTELEAIAIAMNGCLSEASFASDCVSVKCEALQPRGRTRTRIEIPGGIRLPRPRF